MKLFIVESPAKISTLIKILKKLKIEDEFLFFATLGHIKDLPVKKLGIDLKNFTPELIFLPYKRRLLSRLKSISAKVQEVFLATDPDREGEAISHHLYEFISEANQKINFKRIDLIEITEHGVRQAMKNPREINLKIYEAWLARRVLDRLIGYLISPRISRSFKQNLSAGRVQSVALRLVVEKEEEIENFVPETRYFLELELTSGDKKICGELFCKKEKVSFFTKKEAENLGKALKGKKLLLKKIVEKKEKLLPPPPLKTTSLIELAQKKLGFSPKETMLLAQKLYENGFITYMRTDSIRVSDTAKKSAKEFIKELFGEEYVGRGRYLKKGKFVQDAHECIRPTKLALEKVPLSQKENQLYSLIRFYFILSQMASAIFAKKVLIFSFQEKKLKNYFLKISLKKLIFDGFLRLSKKEIKEVWMDVEANTFWEIQNYKVCSYTTKPPERYTSATLIKKLESMGIGRPSTYANLLEVLFKRNYVFKEGKYLKPTELGKKVNAFLKENFAPFVDYEFTARMEKELEEILAEKKKYFNIVSEVYDVIKSCSK